MLQPAAQATFPKGQQIAERFMNRLCGEALGQPGDYTYGAMLINAGLLNETPLLPDNLGWGWRFFLIAAAHQPVGPAVTLTPGAGYRRLSALLRISEIGFRICLRLRPVEHNHVSQSGHQMAAALFCEDGR
jgi:hypothetical protein